MDPTETTAPARADRPDPSASPLTAEVEKWRTLARKHEARARANNRAREQAEADRDRWQTRARENRAALDELRLENRALIDRLTRRETRP